MISRLRPAFAALISGLCIFTVVAQGPPAVDPPAPTIPHVVPGVTGSRTPADFYVFSWGEFFALNWPVKLADGHLPVRGVPDTGKAIGDLSVPRVWETWKADYELFPPQPASGVATPTPWDSWDVAVPACPSEPGARLLPFMAKGESVIPGGVNQAMGGPLVDQHGMYVRYEVRVNRSEYEETVAKSWFLRKNLSVDPKSPNLFRSSTSDTYGAIEIKAAWRIMTPQEQQANPPRYYMTDARVVDPATGKCSAQPLRFGLVGFHIAHKTDPFAAWVWSTFEQVDNVPAPNVPAPALGYSFNDGKTTSTPLKFWGFTPTSAYQPVAPHSLKPEPATPVQTIRLNPIRDEIQTINDQVHRMDAIKGTVWANYELVETQWQTAFPVPIQVSDPATATDLYPQLKGFPEDAVANVTMETYFQGFQGKPPDPAKNRINIPIFGTSCLHCHYQAAQYDFSWMLADQAWPSSPATQGTTKAVSHNKRK
jgi:hypothetical protein